MGHRRDRLQNSDIQLKICMRFAEDGKTFVMCRRESWRPEGAME